MKTHNGTPPIPSVPGGVPIIGQGVWMGCSQGHVEKLAGPFAMTMPAQSAGDAPIVVSLCRLCWLNFVRMFGARALDAEEVDALRAEGQLPGESRPV